MSDDRSFFLPADHHHTSRWGERLPQRAFLAVLLCAPLSSHAQIVTNPTEPRSSITAGHDMEGAEHGIGHLQADQTGRAPKPGTAGGPEPPLEPRGNISPGRQGFAPNVTGPGLAPSVPEEQANHFGVDGALATARANTSEADRVTKEPVELDVEFGGPLWTVKKQRLEATVHGFGIVEINEDTLRDAVITQSGIVRGLYVFPGMEVKVGQPLTSIYSPERVNAQHMLLADFSKDEGNQISLQYYSSFSSAQKYLDHSRSNLKWWGFSDADIDALLKTQQIKEDYVFQADQDSYVVETLKNPGAVVVAGDKSEENFVIPGEQVMRMANLDSVWAMSFVNPGDDALLRLGDTLTIQVGEGEQKRSQEGLIVHKHENAEPAVRKADFHVLLANRDRAVPPGSLVSFSKQEAADGLWIPTKALLYVRGRPTVIRKGANGYEAVEVTVGTSSGELSRVLGGLNEGDQVLAAPRTELNPDARISGLSSWD